MAGLDDPEVIDLITEGRDGEFALIISHDRPWTDSTDELERLREKINNYAAFALEEGLVTSRRVAFSLEFQTDRFQRP